MVKFARAILLKMRVKRMELAEKLGDDTLNLELRIGKFCPSVRKRSASLSCGTYSTCLILSQACTVDR